MPRISKSKEDKIKESVLAVLFQQTPKALFTYHIAQELARDEEFIKRIMQELEAKELVYSVKKNALGKDYSKRIRWRLSEKAFQAYKNLNGNANAPMNVNETKAIVLSEAHAQEAQETQEINIVPPQVQEEKQEEAKEKKE